MAVVAVKTQMPDETRPKIPISGDWVLKRIQEEEKVRLRNAVIEGNLDLSKLNLPTQRLERTESPKGLGLTEDVKILQSSIIITDSVIRERLNFGNTIFNGRSVYFHGTTFIDVDLRGAIFNQDAIFSETTFRDGAYLAGATFSGNANFWGTTFNREAFFRRTTFKKNHFQEERLLQRGNVQR